MAMWAKEAGWDNVEDCINVVLEAGLGTKLEEEEWKKRKKKDVGQ